MNYNMEVINNKTFKVIGDNGYSKILVSDKSINVLVNGSNALYPVGIVSILPSIKIELGRDIDEFKMCLKMVRKPLGIQKVYGAGDYDTWYILRLHTGKVPEGRICTINTFKNKMAAISFNPKLVYNEEFRRYEELSVLHQLRVGKSGDNKILSKAISYISLLTGEPSSNFSVKDKKDIIHIKIFKGDRAYKYSFYKDPNNYVNLLGVSLVI